MSERKTCGTPYSGVDDRYRELRCENPEGACGSMHRALYGGVPIMWGWGSPKDGAAAGPTKGEA